MHHCFSTGTPHPLSTCLGFHSPVTLLSTMLLSSRYHDDLLLSLTDLRLSPRPRDGLLLSG